MGLKVLSWNIWIYGYFDKWINFLRAADADIIGLQEVKDDDSHRDIIKLLTDLGYKHVFAPIDHVFEGKKYRHGPAIFSKFPIKYSERIDLGYGDDKRAAVYAQIDVNGRIYNFFNNSAFSC